MVITPCDFGWFSSFTPSYYAFSPAHFCGIPPVLFSEIRRPKVAIPPEDLSWDPRPFRWMLFTIFTRVKLDFFWPIPQADQKKYTADTVDSPIQLCIFTLQIPKNPPFSRNHTHVIFRNPQAKIGDTIGLSERLLSVLWVLFTRFTRVKLDLFGRFRRVI